MRAAALRQQIEQTLSRRVDGALTPRLRQAPDRRPSGIAALDRLLGGGLPVGAISELVGPESSGRSAVALSFVASRLAENEVAAWIDASDTLDPESAAALGVPLKQMLWVRCGASPTSRQNRQETSRGAPQTPSPALDTAGVAVDRSLSVPSTGGGCGSPHPRSEARGLPEALQTLISEAAPPSRTHTGGNKGLVPQRRRDKSIATPGAPNRPLTASPSPCSSPPATSQSKAPSAADTPRLHWRSPYREEQAGTDRLPARRGDGVADRLEAAAQPPAAARTFFQRLSDDPGIAPPSRTPSASLRGLDQALRAADLLLGSSGFAVVVLDLASVPPSVVWRIPLSTWFRFRAAAERSRTSLLLLTQHPCARSAAELVLDLHAEGFTSAGSVMTGIRWHAAIARERFAAPPAPVPNVVSIIRKPPQSERPGAWSGAAPWSPPPAITPPQPAVPSPAEPPGLTEPATPSPSPTDPSGKLAEFRRRPA